MRVINVTGCLSYSWLTCIGAAKTTFSLEKVIVQVEKSFASQRPSSIHCGTPSAWRVLISKFWPRPTFKISFGLAAPCLLAS